MNDSARNLNRYDLFQSAAGNHTYDPASGPTTSPNQRTATKVS